MLVFFKKNSAFIFVSKILKAPNLFLFFFHIIFSTKSTPPKKESIVSVIIQPIKIEIKPGEQDKSQILESIHEWNNLLSSFKNFNQISKVLKRVFDSFDKDLTGRINSSELDNVLKSLNVNLSKNALDQILKEGDRDSKLNLNFD